jgi:hypothetical protein
MQEGEEQDLVEPQVQRNKEGQLHGSWTGKNHEGGHMVGWIKEF